MGTGTSVHVSTDLPGIWFTGTLMHQVHGALLVYLLFEVDPRAPNRGRHFTIWGQTAFLCVSIWSSFGWPNAESESGSSNVITLYCIVRPLYCIVIPLYSIVIPLLHQIIIHFAPARTPAPQKCSYVSSYVSSNRLPEKRHNRIGCICLIFLHCEFSNVASNCLVEKIHSHSGCICLTFLHCVFSNASSNCMSKKKQSHIGCISLHCAFSKVYLKCLL